MLRKTKLVFDVSIGTNGTRDALRMASRKISIISENLKIFHFFELQEEFTFIKFFIWLNCHIYVE